MGASTTYNINMNVDFGPFHVEIACSLWVMSMMHPQQPRPGQEHHGGTTTQLDHGEPTEEKTCYHCRQGYPKHVKPYQLRPVHQLIPSKN